MLHARCMLVQEKSRTRKNQAVGGDEKPIATSTKDRCARSKRIPANIRAGVVTRFAFPPYGDAMITADRHRRHRQWKAEAA